MASFQWLAKIDHPMVDWRLLQSFSDVVECGSFRNASIERRAALNTIRTRVDQLERLTGRKLLERKVEGVCATEDGMALLSVVRAMSLARQNAVGALQV